MNTQIKTSLLALCAALTIGSFLYILNIQNGFDPSRRGNSYSPNIELKTVTSGSNGTQITSCIDLPTNEDWIPDGVLSIDEEIITPNEMTVEDIENPSVSSGIHRCYMFSYPRKIEKVGRFIIRKISTSIPDLLSQVDCDKAMDSISESNPGMKITCKVGDHGVAFDYVTLPEGISVEEASIKVKNALTTTISGPWSFEVD